MGTARGFDDQPEVMTSAEVADLLGHPVPVILVWVREGKLPAYREPGTRRWWFDRDAGHRPGRIGSYRRTNQLPVHADELLAWLWSDETRVMPR